MHSVTFQAFSGEKAFCLAVSGSHPIVASHGDILVDLMNESIADVDERIPVHSLDMSSEPAPPRPPDSSALNGQLILLVEALCAAVIAAYMATGSVAVSVIVAATALVTVAVRRHG